MKKVLSIIFAIIIICMYLTSSNAPTAPIVEKTSTAEIIAKTVAVVLGVEALGLIVFIIGKKKRNNTKSGAQLPLLRCKVIVCRDARVGTELLFCPQ